MKRFSSFVRISISLLFVLVSIATTQPAQAGGTPTLPIMLGAYPTGSFFSTVGELVNLNNWLISHGASGLTFAGTFMTLTANYNFKGAELDAAWNAGFVPFINLMPSETWEGSFYDPDCTTTAKIAAGLCDDKITIWADEFKAWAGTTKHAYFAPFPEMNSNWVSYMDNSTNVDFINAFKRIRSIFEARGVPRSAVRWVFAPNGWNNPQAEEHEFENFYPGDLYTDVVAFSAYNYGGCPYEYPIWDLYDHAFKPYVDRMVAMAPTKPLFIAQTGSVDVPVDYSDPTQNRSDWIRSVFSDLANAKNVRAIIYFNQTKSEDTLRCSPADYRFYNPATNTGEQGLIDIMSDSRFGQWTATDSRWGTVAFSDPAYTFEDVLPSHPFSGEPNVWYYDYVGTLYDSGITGGCHTNPLLFCPNDSVNRAQMAVFLERGMHGSSFTPPDVLPTFGDTAGHWAEDWIEALRNDGITSGCGGGNYCPEDAVTRAQMALFLLRAKHGASYTPPDVAPTFGDTAGHWAEDWIEQLYVEGITSGCGGGNYCPEDAVTRAQMAVFLVRTFNLP